MMKKRIAALLALPFLLLLLAPPVAVRADISSGVGTGTEMGSGVTKPYRRDENYVDVQPGDIPVWDNGDGIYISGGGQTYRFSGNRHYLAAVSKYLDKDGEYTVQVDLWLASNYCSDEQRSMFAYSEERQQIESDGSVQLGVATLSPDYVCNAFTFRLRDGKFMSRRGEWGEDISIFWEIRKDGSSRVDLGWLYATPFFEGKYKIYCSPAVKADMLSPYTDLVGFDVNPLPNYREGMDSGMPYKTTFRMLSGGFTTYNTFYYGSSYRSGSDMVSASGGIRLVSTRLADGVMQFQSLTAPQPLCQISTYGTAYDIVYTNDDNLLSLLGIEKPPEKYWDVSAQEWKPVPSGSGSGGTGGDTPAITPEPGINTIDHSLSPLSNFVKWLAAKGYPVAADVVYFLGDVDSAYGAFESLLDEYLGYYTYNEKVGRFGSILDGVSDDWKKISDSSVAGLVRKDFTDRFSLDTEKQVYTWSPSKLVSAGVAGVDMALGVGASGTGGTGSGGPDNPSPSPGTGTGTGSGNPGSGTGSGGITIIDGPGWDIIGDISSSVQTGIVDGVTSTGGFLSGVLGSAKGILLDLGGVPALLAEFFSFLPSEVITAIGIGLSLWLLPALLGLARSGLRGLGSICSSFFGFISSLFS